jgi:hypothetical protein
MKTVLQSLYLPFLLTAIMISSCEEGLNRDRAAASSSGSPYEMLIVHDGDTSVQHVLNQTFGQPFPGLPQPESWFTLRYAHVDNLVNLHKRQRNIVFAGSFESENKLSGIMKDIFGEERINEILDDPDRFYASARNVWARPQIVIAFFDNNYEDLVEKIEANKEFLVEQMDAVETRRFRSQFMGSPANQRAVTRLQNRHDLYMRVPPLFNVAEDFVSGDDERLKKAGIDGLVWLRGETDKSNQEILIYYVPYTDKKQFYQENILSLRDSVGKYFIPGPAEGTYMQTEYRYFPRKKEMELNDEYAIELRGLWRVEGAFMGGPFVHYAIYDEANKRIIYVDGFIFAPEDRKRNFVKRLEVALQTIASGKPE